MKPTYCSRPVPCLKSSIQQLWKSIGIWNNSHKIIDIVESLSGEISASIILRFKIHFLVCINIRSEAALIVTWFSK